MNPQTPLGSEQANQATTQSADTPPKPTFPPSRPLPDQPTVVNVRHPERRKIIILVVLMILVLGAGVAYYIMSGNKNPGSSTTNNTTPTTTETPKIELKHFATGLSKPTAIVSTGIANDSQILVVERSGKIRLLTKDGTIMNDPFLDISKKVLDDGEMGLLGLAFSPRYSNDGYFFVNYIDKDQNTVLARYRISANDNMADMESEQILLRVKQPFSNHNGGNLAFGPDGYLYVAMGDGGGAGDPQNLAQNPSSLLGKMLRLDVSQLPYKIPADNPYNGQANKRPEIWALGLRNPWGISFDRKLGDMYIPDVGQNKQEEVNFAAKGTKGGLNYGWRCYEGTETYNAAGCLDKAEYTAPAFTYGHDNQRCSITGGYIYRGSTIPSLDGTYIYGDFCTGEVLTAKAKDKVWETTTALDSDYQISAFGQDNRGELYAADFKDGTVYRITAKAN